jgi:hypothetical protein
MALTILSDTCPDVFPEKVSGALGVAMATAQFAATSGGGDADRGQAVGSFAPNLRRMNAPANRALPATEQR